MEEHPDVNIYIHLPDGCLLYTSFRKNQEYLPSLPEVPAWQGIAKRKELYIATVPLMKGVRGNPNLQIGKTMDLRVTLLYPEQGRENYPCIINIHGYGGHHHSFDPIKMCIRDSGKSGKSLS